MNNLNISNCEIYHKKDFKTNTTYNELREELLWTQKTLKMYGKDILEPRKTFICGEIGTTYTFTGLKTNGEGIPKIITSLMKKVEDVMKKKGLMNPKDKYNFCKTNQKIISIVSRVSLADAHYDTFSENNIDIVHYKIEEPDEQKSIIVTIDSLLKISNFDFKDYVIFLDEFNSLIQYLFTSPHMKNIKILCWLLLMKII